MLYIVALRQFTAAANIPGMIDVVVEFLQNMGNYTLTGYESLVPSAATCKRLCQYLTRHMVDTQLAVEYHCGRFWRDNLCMFRDGSSVNGQSVETMGSIQRVGNSTLPPLEWDDDGVLDLIGLSKGELQSLITHRGGDFYARDSRDSLTENLRAMSVQLTRKDVGKMSRDSLRLECDMLGVSESTQKRPRLEWLYNHRLRHRSRVDDVVKEARKTKGGQVALFESLHLGIPKVLGKDQHCMAEAIVHRIDAVHSKQVVLFGEEILETASPLDQHQWTMTDKASSEDCVNLLLSQHSPGAARLAQKRAALKCMQHALCSVADGITEYCTRFRERAEFDGYEHGAMFAFYIISSLISTSSFYEHNVIEQFGHWCSSAEGGGGQSIKVSQYCPTRSHLNVQYIESLLSNFDAVCRFFETLAAGNKKAAEINGFFEDSHSVDELLLYKFWAEHYFRPMQGRWINANVPYLDAADAFRIAWRTMQRLASREGTLWTRLLISGVGVDLCPFSKNTNKVRTESAVESVCAFLIARVSWEEFAAGSLFEGDDEAEPTVEQQYGMWESLIENALEEAGTNSGNSFLILFRRHRAPNLHFSLRDSFARHEAFIVAVSESMHWTTTYSQSRAEASLVDGVLDLSKLRDEPGIENAPGVNDVGESSFGVVKYVARQFHRGYYETVEAMTLFLLNRTFEFYLELRTENPQLFEKCLDHLDGLSRRSLAKRMEEERKADSEKVMSRMTAKKEEKTLKLGRKKKKEADILAENVKWESVSDMELALGDCETEKERKKLLLGQIRLIKLEVSQREDLEQGVARNVKNALKLSEGGVQRSYTVIKRAVREFVHCHNHDEWGSFAEREEQEAWAKIAKHEHKLRRNKKKCKFKECALCSNEYWDHWGCARCKYYLCDSCLDSERLPVAGVRIKGKKRKRNKKCINDKQEA